MCSILRERRLIFIKRKLCKRARKVHVKHIAAPYENVILVNRKVVIDLFLYKYSPICHVYILAAYMYNCIYNTSTLTWPDSDIIVDQILYLLPWCIYYNFLMGLKFSTLKCNEIKKFTSRLY